MTGRIPYALRAARRCSLLSEARRSTALWLLTPEPVARRVRPLQRAGWKDFPFFLRREDWSVVDQVWFEEEYAAVRPLLAETADPLVVDVGANIGCFALWVFAIAPRARVVSIEPSPSTFSVLERNRAANAHLDWRVVRAAAWSEERPLPFESCPGVSSYSRVGEGGRETVPGRTLDSMLLGEPVGRLALVKLDVEGAEAPVLSGAPATLRAARALIVEVHGDEGDESCIRETLAEAVGSVDVTRRSPGRPLLLARRHVAPRGGSLEPPKGPPTRSQR